MCLVGKGRGLGIVFLRPFWWLGVCRYVGVGVCKGMDGKKGCVLCFALL